MCFSSMQIAQGKKEEERSSWSYSMLTAGLKLAQGARVGDRAASASHSCQASIPGQLSRDESDWADACGKWHGQCMSGSRGEPSANAAARAAWLVAWLHWCSAQWGPRQESHDSRQRFCAMHLPAPPPPLEAVNGGVCGDGRPWFVK